MKHAGVLNGCAVKGWEARKYDGTRRAGFLADRCSWHCVGHCVFERLLHLRQAQIDYNDFLKGVCNVLENGHIDEPLMICEETPGQWRL